ncbi:MOSC N-terminal beta barrel domain-containing protein [soil metagenome]
MTTGPRVTALRRYPVKACAAEHLTSTLVGVDGLPGDRLLAVTVGDEIVTQRELPRLARVRPTLDDATGLLHLAYDGREPVEAVVDTDRPTRTVTIFGSPVDVVDQAEVLSRWFGAVLDTSARLVAAPPSTRRTSPGEVEGRTVLSDEGTVSLHSEASLARLNDALARRGQAALTSDRFRANIVIDGVAAHAEDDAHLVDSGDVRMAFAQVDERCVVTTVDQRAGARSGPEPLRTLADYRRIDGGGVAFGIYTAVLAPGRVSVGDAVRLSPRS